MSSQTPPSCPTMAKAKRIVAEAFGKLDDLVQKNNPSHQPAVIAIGDRVMRSEKYRTGFPEPGTVMNIEPSIDDSNFLNSGGFNVRVDWDDKDFDSDRSVWLSSVYLINPKCGDEVVNIKVEDLRRLVGKIAYNAVKATRDRDDPITKYVFNAAVHHIQND